MTWVVVKLGVYLHEVWGPFDNRELAGRAAEKFAEKEPDAHHTIEVRSLNPKTGLGDAVSALRGTEEPGRHWWEQQWPSAQPSSIFGLW